MDNDNLMALSRLMRQGFLGEVGMTIVGGELRSRGLAVPHGFKPLAVKQEECDDLSGGPPS